MTGYNKKRNTVTMKMIPQHKFLIMFIINQEQIIITYKQAVIKVT